MATFQRARALPNAAPTVALLLVTALWGSTFSVSKVLTTTLPVDDFLALRFIIAAAAVAAIRPRSLRGGSAPVLRRGLGLGAIYAAAQIPQHIGISHAPASVSAFLTGLYVVFTPLLAGLLLRRRVPRRTVIAALVASGGLAVLSLRGLSVGFGELLCTIGAVVYAFHILALGRWSTPANAARLALWQLVALAGVTTLYASADGIRLPTTSWEWGALIYLALAAGAVAMVAQTWAQARMAAPRAAVVMASEPLWAAVLAVTWGGEAFTGRLALGGAMVIAGIYIALVPPRRTGTGGAAGAERPPRSGGQAFRGGC